MTKNLFKTLLFVAVLLVYGSAQAKNTLAECALTLRTSETYSESEASILGKFEDLFNKYDGYADTGRQGDIKRGVKRVFKNAKSKCYGISEKIDKKIDSLDGYFEETKANAYRGNPKIRDTDTIGTK